MKITCILPARMGSSRFPGKPLKKILGLTMIEHVYRRVALCSEINSVVVATCDEEIKMAVEGFGGRAVMTSASHVRASDRVAEAAEKTDADIIVMVQGDEPMVTPGMIKAAVDAIIADESVGCVNLMKKIDSEAEYLDPNTIKVVFDHQKHALYFSREPVPTRRVSDFGRIAAFKQICIIPFRRQMLQTYARLVPTPLEIAESVDMIRLLEHGYGIKLAEVFENSHAVDTHDDLKKVEAMMRHDPLTARYLP